MPGCHPPGSTRPGCGRCRGPKTSPLGMTIGGNSHTSEGISFGPSMPPLLLLSRNARVPAASLASPNLTGSRIPAISASAARYKDSAGRLSKIAGHLGDQLATGCRLASKTVLRAVFVVVIGSPAATAARPAGRPRAALTRRSLEQRLELGSSP